MRHAVVAVVVLSAHMAGAETVLSRFSWEERRAELEAGGGQVLAPETAAGAWRLRIERREPGPAVPLLAIDAPRLATREYAVRGRVRYEAVEGDAFLEMWSVFPDGSRYFSRTVAARGPLRTISGTSRWRWFVLPFTVTAGAPLPARLEVNLALPGRGIVEMESPELVQLDPGDDAMRVPGDWWSERQAGLAGGLLGLILGGLGAAGGWLAARGRSLHLAIRLLVALGAAGALALLLGLLAVFTAQPWAVFYPLLLGGGISTALAALLTPLLRRRRTEAELQRMRARDLG